MSPKANIDSHLEAQSMPLTASVEVLNGTVGNDTFNAVDTEISTLNGFDSINGGAGNDTLNIVATKNAVTNVNVNTSLPSSATVSGIETVNIAYDTDANGSWFRTGSENNNDYIDAARFDGVKTLTQIAQANQVRNVAQGSTAVFAGYDADLNTAVSAEDSATRLVVDVQAVGDSSNNGDSYLAVGGKALSDVELKGALATGESKIGLDVVVGKDVQAVKVSTAVNTQLWIEDSTQATWGAQWANIAGYGGTKTVTSVDASSSTGDIEFDGEVYKSNTTNGDDLATIKTGSGDDTVAIKTVTVKDVAATLTVDETVTATLSTSDGDDSLTVNTTGDGITNVNAGAGDDAITVDVGQGANSGSYVIAAGDGDDSLTLTARGTAKLIVTMGAGDDTVGSVTLGAGDTVDLGAGDDQITVSGSSIGAGGSLTGGDGTDTLVMSAADAAAATASAAAKEAFADRISSIEKLSIGMTAAGVSNTVDLARLNNINNVTVDGVDGTSAPRGEIQVLDLTGAQALVTAGAQTGVFYAFDGNGGQFANGGNTYVWLGQTSSDADVALAVQQQLTFVTPQIYIGQTLYTVISAAIDPNDSAKVIVEFDLLDGDVPDLTFAGDGNNSPAVTLSSVVEFSAFDPNGTSASLDLNNLAANGTIEFTSPVLSDSSIGVKDAATGTADAVNLKLTSADGFTNTGVITISDVEAVNVVTDDSDTTAATAAFVAPLAIAATKTLTVSGDAGLDLTGSTLTALTSVDASGLTATGAAGGLTVALTATTGTSVTGGAGNDVITVAAAATGKTNTVIAGGGNDVVNGDTGNDNINGGAGDDNIAGNGGVDTLTGGDGNDLINGGAGVDTISGDAGDDTLNGSGGADIISGGAGADVITGGAGADALSGGTGRDAFVIAAADSGVTTTTIDKISDFGVLSSAIATTDTFANAAAFQALSKGGDNADVLDLAGTTKVAAAAITQFGTLSMTALAAVTGTDLLVTSDVKYAVNAKGLVSLSGVDAAKVDTLAEWVAVAQQLATQANEVLVFNLNGNAYVYLEGGANDNVVELTGVTVGAAGGLVVSTAAGAIGDIVIA